ncbi:zincin-like metallopeptidase domain-containing protein [Nitrobacter sp. NHB1]|uniref:zincin-like metallopeptidase domain-containing protein n=1 Tax=Nitrobacter sp. NHB1 TaxID=3119830 RepID=UPI003FA5A29C
MPAVDAFIKAIWANIFIGGNRAFYDTSCDRIHLPDPSQFRTAEYFYATNLHESVHYAVRWIMPHGQALQRANRFWAKRQFGIIRAIRKPRS